VKDYVIKINDVVPWRVALRAEAEAGSGYVSIDEDTDEVRLNLPQTGIIAQVGNSVVSILRLNQNEYDWLTGLPQVSVLGTCTEFIKGMNDIDWIGAGKGLYHSIHTQDPIEVDDGEGGTVFINPSELHCILAS